MWINKCNGRVLPSPATARRFSLGAAVGLVFFAGIANLQAQQPVLPPGVTVVSGFPKTLTGGQTSHGEPVIADLGLTPGHKQIIFGTYSHKLYVLNSDGSVASGFPVTLPGDIYSSPAIGDVDGDGNPDIVVGYGSTIEVAQTGLQTGGVCAYKRNGSQIWCRTAANFDNNPNPDPVVSTPAIGDIDGDGKNEVAWGGLDANVYVVNGATGADKTGWPHFVRDTIFSSPALADLVGDGRLEVIIGVDAHKEGSPFNTPNGGCLHVFQYDATELPGFPQCVDQVIVSSPAIGDINGDGKPEIVVGTGNFWNSSNNGTGVSPTHVVYAFKCDGTQAAGWPVAVDGQVTTSPAIGDIDGDGTPDVVVTDNNSSPSTTFHVYGFKGNGTRLFKTVPKSFSGTTPNAGSPRIANILGTSTPEIIVPVNTELCVLSSSGTQLSDPGTHASGTFSFYTDTGLSGVAIGDLDNDGAANEMVAVSAAPFPSATDTKVFAWTLPTNAIPAWGLFKYSPSRLSVVPGTPGCQIAASAKFYTLTPCRIADTRNSAGPYGGPSLSAGTARDFVLAGQCGVPADAKSVSINLAVIPNEPGDLKIYPAGTAPTLATFINFPLGRVLANNGMEKLGNGGAITVQNDQASGSVDIVIDTNGYFK